MFQVKCPKCNEIREVQARKPWMQGDEPYEKVCPSCCQKGKVKTEEHRRKLSESVKAIQTDELREKKRQCRLRRPDLIEKLQPGKGIEAWTGSHHTDETRQAISDALIGKEVTQETRDKISETIKKRNKHES